MKARRIDLTDAFGVEDAMRRIAIVRFAEVLTLSASMHRRKPDELHDFRIACKRARYMLERFAPREPALMEAALRFGQLQDALGEAHDRDVLLSRMNGAAPQTTSRLKQQREACVDRALALWKDAFAAYGPFEGLVRFTGLQT